MIFSNQIAKFFTGTNFEKLVWNNVANISIIFNFINCLLNKDKVFIKLFVGSFILFLVDFNFRIRQQSVHSLCVYIWWITDNYIETVTTINFSPIKRNDFYKLFR